MKNRVHLVKYQMSELLIHGNAGCIDRYPKERQYDLLKGQNSLVVTLVVEAEGHLTSCRMPDKLFVLAFGGAYVYFRKLPPS